MFCDNLPENVPYKLRPEEVSKQATWTDLWGGEACKRKRKCQGPEVLPSWPVQGTVRGQAWLDLREKGGRGKKQGVEAGESPACHHSDLELTKRIYHLLKTQTKPTNQPTNQTEKN